MKEVTAIITCELTDTVVIPDGTQFPPANVRPPYTATAHDIKELLEVDDVNIKLVQFFVRDLPNTSEAVVETPDTAVQGG